MDETFSLLVHATHEAGVKVGTALDGLAVRYSTLAVIFDGIPEPHRQALQHIEQTQTISSKTCGNTTG